MSLNLQSILLGPTFARDFADAGIKRYAKGDLNGALPLLNEALRRNPTLADAYFVRHGVYYAKGDYASAINDCTIVIRMGKQNLKQYQAACNDRGAAREGRGNYEGGLADATEAIRVGYDNAATATAYCTRVENQIALGDLGGALADLEAALARLSKVTLTRDYLLSYVYATRGMVRSLQGDHTQGLADCELALNTAQGLRAPSMARLLTSRQILIYTYRALIRHALEDNQGAIDDANTAIRMAEGQPDKQVRAYHTLGLIQAAIDERDLALAAFDKAIALCPQYAAAYMARAAAYRAHSDAASLDKAEADMLVVRTLQVDPLEPPLLPPTQNYPFSWVSHRRLINLGVGVLLLSILVLPRLGPGDVNLTRFSDADAALQAQDYDTAINLLQQVVAADKTQALAYQGLCVALSFKQDYAKSLDNCSKAIALDPSAANYANRAAIRYILKDYNNSIADSDQALQLDQRNAKAYYFRARARYDQGDLDGAIADYGQAIGIDPNDAYKFYARGLAYAAKGDTHSAASDFKRALTIQPTHPQADYMKQKLAQWGTAS